MGETLDYTVSYRTGIDVSKGLVYVCDVMVLECIASEGGHYDRLCGALSPIYKLNEFPKDTTVVL